MTTAFNGIRVVDLSDRLSGAFAARLFGDFGADVILAEPPEGHPLRFEPPFLDNRPGIERSAAHAYANWNKRSIIVDGTDALDALIETADVVITTRESLAETPLPDSLARLPADAVHLSITPHGLEDPLSGRAGNNLTASARVGWSYINGFRDEPPLQMPLNQAGIVGGVTGFITAAAALRRRNAQPCVRTRRCERGRSVRTDGASLGRRRRIPGSGHDSGTGRGSATRPAWTAMGSRGRPHGFRSG